MSWKNFENSICYWYLLEMFKNINCLIDSDNLVIFKFRKFKFDLKDHFVNN